MANVLVNLTGQPLFFKGTNIKTFPQLNTCDDEGYYRDRIVSLPSEGGARLSHDTYGNRFDVDEKRHAPRLPEPKEGVFLILPREVVLAFRSIREREDVLAPYGASEVDGKTVYVGVGRFVIRDERMEHFQLLAALQRARFRVMKDSSLTIREALEQGPAYNWVWALSGLARPGEDVGYGYVAAEGYTSTEAEEALTELINQYQEVVNDA